MTGPKLSATERDGIKARIAANDHYADIAASFGCTIDNVKYYARKMKPVIAAAKAERQTTAIHSGLSEVDARVAQLQWLNGLLEADLATGLYGVDIKLSATGKAVEVPAFKGQQVTQLRGTLDDIAKERGGRKATAEVSVAGGVTSTVVTTDLTDMTEEERRVHLATLSATAAAIAGLDFFGGEDRRDGAATAPSGDGDESPDP